MYKTASDIADTVLMKCAEISQDEIARGLSGTPGRKGITQEEIDQYGQDTYDHRYDSASSHPWVGGGVGAFLGAGAGALGGPAGMAIGAGVGGLAGAGLGHLSRRSEATDARELAEGLGGVAQTGRIPYDVPAHELVEYPGFAAGMQEDRINPEATAKFEEKANSNAKQQAIMGALRGAVAGNYLSDRDGGAGELRGTAYGGIAGGLQGWDEGSSRSKQQMDLHERGYGHLADVLQRRNMG